MSYPQGESTALETRIDHAMALFERHGAHPDLADPDTRRDPRAAEFHRESLSENTRNAYRRGISLYLKFCGETGRREVPATASTMEAFVVWCTLQTIGRGKNKGTVGLAPNTIRQALSAVRKFHTVQGENPPDLALATPVVLGYERKRSKQPGNTDGQGVPGLRLPSLAKMFEVCDPATNAGARDRALLAMGWALMSRRSELAAFEIAHVPPPDEDGIEVLVRRSKTDQLGQGRKPFIPWKPELGEQCPVTNIVRWQRILAREGITEGGFFRGVDRQDRINGAPGYQGITSAFMDPQTVELVIARAAVRAVVPNATKLRGHSLRRGGATDLYDAGADILAIARQGGWNPRSPVIFRYIEEGQTRSRNPLRVAKFDTKKKRKRKKNKQRRTEG